MNLKHTALLTSMFIVLNTQLYAADDNSNGKKPRISDIETVYVGDTVTLTINGIHFLGKNNAAPYLSIGNGLFKSPDFTATFTDNQVVVTTQKAKLPNADYLLWISKDKNYSSENSDFFDFTVGAVGPKGDKGDKGTPGLQGLAGATGSQGPKGDTGAMGLPGVPGVAGPQGPKGDTGAMGQQGIQGSPGGAANPSVVFKINTSNSNSGNTNLLVGCPNGTTLISGGCDALYGSDVITYLPPAIVKNTNLNSLQWECQFYGGTGLNMPVSATAICLVNPIVSP